MKIYDYQVKNVDGTKKDLQDYQGKVLLIVNTATHCGFTPQYKGLQSLYLKYKDKGFEVLDFPCNQFMHQAPESDQGIASFCELKYQTTFPRFSKIEVNGDKADPLFVYLKANSNPKGSIKWNFTKFLIDRDGNIVNRYSSLVTPEKIENDIINLL
ncbi:MAG: glutathione peroxidase [Bacillales bacterium]|jgi:glutathione peroxidase|nr:glutathione peroxidase [Bacillales bacterium]